MTLSITPAKLPDEDLQQYKMLSIDPGLNNIGISVFTIESKTQKVLSIESFTIEVEKLTDTSGLDDNDSELRLRKLVTIRNKFKELLEEHQPSVVVSESPFFNPRMPIAFECLVQAIVMITAAIVQHNKNLVLLKLSPQEIKKAIGVAGKLGKDVVKEAVQKIDEIVSLLVEGLDPLSEHAIDSLAVGYCELQLRRKEQKDHEKT